MEAVAQLELDEVKTERQDMNVLLKTEKEENQSLQEELHFQEKTWKEEVQITFFYMCDNIVFFPKWRLTCAIPWNMENSISKFRGHALNRAEAFKTSTDRTIHIFRGSFSLERKLEWAIQNTPEGTRLVDTSAQFSWGTEQQLVQTKHGAHWAHTVPAAWSGQLEKTTQRSRGKSPIEGCWTWQSQGSARERGTTIKSDYNFVLFSRSQLMS